MVIYFGYLTYNLLRYLVFDLPYAPLKLLILFEESLCNWLKSYWAEISPKNGSNIDIQENFTIAFGTISEATPKFAHAEKVVNY